MKKLTLILIALCSYTISNAQICLPESEQDSADITQAELDSIYVKAVLNDTSYETAYKGREEAFAKAYVKMLKDFEKHLEENDFSWDSTTRCYNKIYFAENGKIDYWFYKFLGEVSEEKQKRFKMLLEEFMFEYVFTAQPTRNFRQCSSTSFGR